MEANMNEAAPDGKSGQMVLRPYQKQAVHEAIRGMGKHAKTLVVMPTGCGKTVVFANVAKRAVDSGRRVLVLAHRRELIFQARDRFFQAVGLSCGIEMGPESADGEAVVVSTVQTMSKRLSGFDPEAFGLIIVDEAHHATAKSYQAILDHFSGAYVLGVTATPDRGDGVGLKHAFNGVAYEYEIREAITEGFLCPIRQRSIFVEEMDLSDIRTVAGDFNQGQLEEELRRDEVIRAVASPLLKEAADRRTMVFTVSVAQAHDMAAVLNSESGQNVARALDGTDDTEKRARTLADFRAGDFQFLVNCALFTEGFDDPGISCIACARPTKSRALYTQMVGRGTRIHPGKEDLLVLCFVGNSGRHRLVSALDILDGGELDENTRRRAQERANAGEDIMSAIDGAVADENEAKKRRILSTKARYKVTDVDPFSFFGADARKGRWGGAEMTPAQREALEGKIPDSVLAGLDRGQASAIIGKIQDRARGGLCTFNQAKWLMINGIDPQGMTFDEASAHLDRIFSKKGKR